VNKTRNVEEEIMDSSVPVCRGCDSEVEVRENPRRYVCDQYRKIYRPASDSVKWLSPIFRRADHQGGEDE